MAATLWPGELGGTRDPDQADALLARDIAALGAARIRPVGVRGARERASRWLAPAFSGPAVDDREEVEILYAVAPEHWGKGYAAETAEAALEAAPPPPEIHQVVSVVWTENPASKRVPADWPAARPPDRRAGLPHLLFTEVRMTCQD